MYIVSGMTLIPQKMTMSCWYASAQMVITWRRNKKQSSESGIEDPSEDGLSSQIRDGNSGIQNQQIIAMAQRLGLRPVPPMSPSTEAIEQWLQVYGPLWVNGKTHITVIAGINGDQVLVYDPSPVNVGKIEWRSLSKWYAGSAVDSRDTGKDVDTVFLHCPQ